MMRRIRQLWQRRLPRAAWHQGESDAHQSPEHEIAAAEYRACWSW